MCVNTGNLKRLKVLSSLPTVPLSAALWRTGAGSRQTGKFGVKSLILCVIIITLMMLCSCGYQLVREKGIFGGDITSLYVPIFKNKTYEPHASLYVTDAFTKELISTGLFKINKEVSDGYIEGTIKNIKVLPFTLNKDGIVIEKNMTIDVELSLFRKNGGLIKRWVLSESETYRVDNVGYEDYNKRDALRKVSGRMARKFCSVILVDY